MTIHSSSRAPMTLEEFKEHMKTNMKGSKAQLIRDNVLTATRVFDKKVKTFIKTIVMGRDNPMHILLYTYRVEFQQRGAAHVHGVLWMNMTKLEKTIPGLTRSYSKLKHDRELKDPVVTGVTDGVIFQR